MADKILHASDPAEVASASSLDVLLGEPSRHMLIFTGLAQSKTGSNTEDWPPTRDKVYVKFGRFVAQDPKDGEWSATVGLASISNGDSDYVFATDSVKVERDNSSELQLVVDTAALGQDSAIHSFSYQATVLLQEPQVVLDALLVGPDADEAGLDNQVVVPIGQKWRYNVQLSGPAPGPGVLVSVESTRPDVAPVADPGDSPIHAVVVQPGKTMGDISTAPPTAEVFQDTPVIIKAYCNGVVRAATVKVQGRQR
jgi:hypothetical protein